MTDTSPLEHSSVDDFQQLLDLLVCTCHVDGQLTLGVVTGNSNKLIA